MLIEIRPTTRLRGEKALDLTASLSPIFEALREDSLDLSRVRLVCDWVQYKNNFRDVVDVRTIDTPAAEDKIEIAVDLRRSGNGDLAAIVRDVLAGYAEPERLGRVYLEDWTQGTTSLHLGLQFAVLALPRRLGEGHRSPVRAGAARRRERRPQHRRRT